MTIDEALVVRDVPLRCELSEPDIELDDADDSVPPAPPPPSLKALLLLFFVDKNVLSAHRAREVDKKN